MSRSTVIDRGFGMWECVEGRRRRIQSDSSLTKHRRFPALVARFSADRLSAGRWRRKIGVRRKCRPASRSQTHYRHDGRGITVLVGRRKVDLFRGLWLVPQKVLSMLLGLRQKRNAGARWTESDQHAGFRGWQRLVLAQRRGPFQAIPWRDEGRPGRGRRRDRRSSTTI